MGKRLAAAYTDNLPNGNQEALIRDVLVAMEEAICDESTKAMAKFPEFSKILPPAALPIVEQKLRGAIRHAMDHFLFFEVEWTAMLGKYSEHIPQQLLPFLVMFTIARAPTNGDKLAAMIYRETDKIWNVYDELVPGWVARSNQIAVLTTPSAPASSVAPVIPASRRSRL